MSNTIPAEIRGFVANPPAVASAAVVREFLEQEIIRLDLGLPEPYSEAFWDVTRPRSEGRKVNGWFFMREWNSAFDELSSVERRALVEKFQSVFPVWLISSQEDASMAFHDETTAQRAMSTTIFLDKYADEIQALGFEELEECHQNDLELLESDSFHAGLNNHGMFQDIALLVAHAYDRVDDRVQKIAVQRLLRYFDDCFTSEGIHRENNPTYHVMVSRYVHLVAEYLEQTGDALDLEHLKDVLNKADYFAAFCVTPDGKFPPISDTKVVTLAPRQAVSTYGEGYFLGAITQGQKGTLPSTTSFVADKSGYAIYRDGWDKDSSMLFFSAAYNADYHKHSDELSVYFFAKEHEILREAGPNGYQYNDPLTAYAFSSFAHNTLIVDDQGLPRIDNLAETTTLSKLDERTVVGETRRFQGVTWRRTLEVSDDDSSLSFCVKDEVQSDKLHNYKILWHLGPDVTPQVRGNYIEIFSNRTREKLAEMSLTGSACKGIKLSFGQTHPTVQGIAFPTMGTNVNAHAIEFKFEGKVLDVEWELRTKEFLLNDRGVTPFNAEWKTFYGEKPVRYLLDLPKGGNPEKLLFVFSAVNPLNDFTYNYRSSLADYDGAVAYILDDFGDQGSYYLANGREFSEFRSVQGAMREIRAELGVPLENTFTLGSSKGGTGAIVHGVSMGVNTVFAGGPQYKIGLFTSGPHPNILKYLSDGTDPECVAWADRLVLNVLKNGSRRTNIVVMVGKADGHYRHHAVPLTDDARALGYAVDLLVVPGTPHSELGGAFRQFITSFVGWSRGETFILPNVVGFDAKTKEVAVAVHLRTGMTGLAQLQIDGKPVGKPQRIHRGGVTWKVEQSGVARARIYIDKEPGEPRVAFGSAPVRVKR